MYTSLVRSSVSVSSTFPVTLTSTLHLISSSFPSAPLMPVILPVICTLPAFTPVTTPSEATVAMDLSLLSHAMDGKFDVSVSVLPSSFVYTSFDGFTVSVAPAAQLSALLDSSRLPDLIFAASTVTVHVALAVSVVSAAFLTGSCSVTFSYV